MRPRAKPIIAFTMAYIITRSISRFVFNPYANLGLWPSILVDLMIWVLIFIICSAVVEKITSRQSR